MRGRENKGDNEQTSDEKWRKRKRFGKREREKRDKKIGKGKGR